MFATRLGWLVVAVLLLGCGGLAEDSKSSASAGQGGAGGRAGGGGAEPAGATASRAGNAGSGGATGAAAAALCTSTRGTVSTGDCCLTAPDFPDTCALGACSCLAGSSHRVELCECPADTCFDTAAGCVPG
jgi:hypothetical protein